MELSHAGGFLSLPLRPAYWEEMARRQTHADEFRRIADRFPIGPETTVICQSEPAIHFYRRAKVYDVPELGLGRSRPARADYFVFDGGNYTGSCDYAGIDEIRNELAQDPDYRMFRYRNGVLIFARRSVLPPDFN
ncbi:hypothetical protein SDC9_191755 [bioreactor metagenome]|uniref:Uncharacterized protein n=1 Tax=bioreactor metagenome TaxID=1076179 RepID=A0A645I716_9ZZZZ